VTTDGFLDLSSDPQKFEQKVVELLLRRYRQHFGVSRAVVDGIDSFDRFNALENNPFTIWGYKVVKKLNLGSILNSLEKSILATPLRAGLRTYRDAEDWLYVFSIPTSTALYAMVNGDSLSPSDCAGMRFIVYKQFENELLAVVRLDDLLDLRWPLTT